VFSKALQGYKDSGSESKRLALMIVGLGREQGIKTVTAWLALAVHAIRLTVLLMS
jgi:hypothetical protein